MFAIANTLLSDEIIEKKFVCNLEKCKGNCCEEGDAGAPLKGIERATIDKIFYLVEPMLSEAAKKVVEKEGRYIYHQDFGWVTPLIDDGLCVYGNRDETGIIGCIFEKLFMDHKTNWIKPISCHLFPIKISSAQGEDIEFVNYEPRPSLCKSGCQLGKKLHIPVYQFLKPAIVRKFGQAYYNQIEIFAEQYFKEKK